MPCHTQPSHAAPALGGADTELANFIQGLDASRDTCVEAATAILAEIDGRPVPEPMAPLYELDTFPQAMSAEPRRSFDPQDWSRKYLPSNGGCVYIDLGHTEVCVPEVTSARDYVAYWHAMLGIVREAQIRADQRLPAGQQLKVLVNNSDGRGNSFGAHLNFLMRRETYDDLLTRNLPWLMFLASYQVSSIVFTGQGKVGSENGQPHAAFQLSQRADFFETMSGVQTTFRRPIVNLRDESLCRSTAAGPDDGQWARLHVIFFDANLCEVANLLKFGVMQVVLAMIAEGFVDPALIIADPLAALTRWSRDLAMRRRVPLLLGGEATAVELQLRFAAMARSFVDSGRCAVPDAATILDLWEDTLQKLRSGDLDALRPRLDWTLKLSAIEHAVRGGLTWDAPQIKYLDHLYASLDPGEGLYWAFRRGGGTERIVDDRRIERAMEEPPDDTRAWTRAMLLRAARPRDIRTIDWDTIELDLATPSGWRERRKVETGDPLGHGRDQCAAIFEDGAGLAEIVERLEAARDVTA